MSKPYKMTETLKYTETVYYNAKGEEVSRDRNYDDWLYDSGVFEYLTEEEIGDHIEDHIGEEN